MTCPDCDPRAKAAEVTESADFQRQVMEIVEAEKARIVEELKRDVQRDLELQMRADVVREKQRILAEFRRRETLRRARSDELGDILRRNHEKLQAELRVLADAKAALARGQQPRRAPPRAA